MKKWNLTKKQRTYLQECEEEIEKQRKQLQECEEEIENLKKEIKDSKNSIAGYKAYNTRLAKRNEVLEKDVKTLEELVSKLSEERGVAELIEEIAALKRSNRGYRAANSRITGHRKGKLAEVNKIDSLERYTYNKSLFSL